jgi:iron complex transport system permease protein
MLCGPDYRWMLAYSVLLAPIVLLVADIIGRTIVSPGELQVGVVLGVLGAPAFVALVRFRNLAEV